MEKAVFFDRDGIINRDYGYVYAQEDFVFNPSIFDLLRFFKERGYLLLVVTNQSGIARGYYTEEDFLDLTDFMQSQLQEKLGFGFDKVYYCPHLEGCTCRKPDIGMIRNACCDFAIDLSQSLLIGDKVSDILTAHNAGIGGKFLLTHQKTDEALSGVENLFIVRHLEEIAQIIEEENRVYS
ncbi:D,D-heptose 1,7-bisphosphate phosphatase [Helicobacter enhydrae]|uniref:D,D-heptose 1,7-bisphosphate phosphatase n=1 Tax=Helicobacter enhydrae TaxID=222136 RepID=A0A1B1U4H7_9HELI|nr:HAD family hydrolase [Helicobacter enhydrae]ANV97660.1 D,D-heptose 1,7-bisphosphate phosphatase [Helicobacter enhydrae]